MGLPAAPAVTHTANTADDTTGPPAGAAHTREPFASERAYRFPSFDPTTTRPEGAPVGRTSGSTSGDDRTGPPVWNRHSFSPVSAASA